jgi:hypothetical protein
LVETGVDRVAETVAAQVIHDADQRKARRHPGDDVARAIRAVVVDDDHFVGNVLAV